MNFELKKLPKSRVSLTIEISPEELEEYSKKALRKISLSQNIKGFRAGKAPLDLVEKAVGKERVFKEAIDSAVKESYIKAILEQKLDTIDEPKIEVVKTSPGEPLVFKAEVAVLPEVNIDDYSSIKIAPEETKVEESEIDAALKTLQKSRAKYATVLTPAKKGDRVEIDFETKAGGVNLEDGSSKQHPLIIGEGHFMKGFEDELVGMKEGEEKTFSLVAPQDHQPKNIAGRKVDFKVKMNLVQEVELPDLDDEFAQRLGKFATMEELKRSINEGLLEEKKSKEKEKVRIKIVEALLEKASLEVPEALVEREINKMTDEFASSLKNMGIDQDSYLSHIKKSLADLKKDWHEQAEKRVKASLVLREIAKREAIDVSEEEVDEKVSQLIKSIPNPEALAKIDIASLKDYVNGLIRNEKVFEFLEKKIIKKA